MEKQAEYNIDLEVKYDHLEKIDVNEIVRKTVAY